MESAFSLEGKCILVTGASSGIGRGISVACAKMGAKVVLSGRNETRLQETLASLEGEGHLVLCGDLNIEETRKDVVDKMPALNGVVYCAGISQIQMVGGSLPGQCLFTIDAKHPFVKEKENSEELIHHIHFFNIWCLSQPNWGRRLWCNQSCTCWLC